MPVPVFPGQSVVRFSTSEPRVLLEDEFTYLQRSFSSDPAFLKMFCENAWRTWEPLWCLERETHASGAEMDMHRWLCESLTPS
jgi:hypothetical protein